MVSMVTLPSFAQAMVLLLNCCRAKWVRVDGFECMKGAGVIFDVKNEVAEVGKIGIYCK